MNTINIKQIMVRIFLLIAVLSFSFTTYAKGEFISVSTVHSNSPDKAYGHRLGNDVWGIWNSIEENMEADKSTKHKNFDKALIRADKVIEKFKSVFDKNKIQYVFEHDSHYEKFIKINGSDFQRIDNSYKEALQIKAYIYSDLKEYGKALEYLEEVQSVAPASARSFIEQGYIFSQYKLNDLATSAYVKAEYLARKYPEGQLISERASALRGMGFILIEEGKLDEAKAHYEQSLEIDPGSKVAINELKYIASVLPNRWKYIADDWYIDTSSIEKKDGNIFIWQMLNSEGMYKPTQTPTLSKSLLFEYDCSASTYVFHAIKMYEKKMGKGELIAKYKLQGEVADVPSSPTMQLLYKKSCSYLNN